MVLEEKINWYFFRKMSIFSESLKFEEKIFMTFQWPFISIVLRKNIEIVEIPVGP